MNRNLLLQVTWQCLRLFLNDILSSQLPHSSQRLTLFDAFRKRERGGGGGRESCLRPRTCCTSHRCALSSPLPLSSPLSFPLSFPFSSPCIVCCRSSALCSSMACWGALAKVAVEGPRTASPAVDPPTGEAGGTQCPGPPSAPCTASHGRL